MWTLCQWIQAIWDRDWDCTPRPINTVAVVFFSLFIIAGGIFLNLVYRDKVAFAHGLSLWMRALPKRKVQDITLWEISVAGSILGFVVSLAVWTFDGFTPLGFLCIPAGILLLLSFQLSEHREQNDPHKDIPADIRAKTTEELKQYNEYLAELNRTRELRGQQQSTIDSRAAALTALKEKRAELKRKHPTLSSDEIDRLIEPEEFKTWEKI